MFSVNEIRRDAYSAGPWPGKVCTGTPRRVCFLVRQVWMRWCRLPTREKPGAEGTGELLVARLQVLPLGLFQRMESGAVL